MVEGYTWFGKSVFRGKSTWFAKRIGEINGKYNSAKIFKSVEYEKQGLF